MNVLINGGSDGKSRRESTRTDEWLHQKAFQMETEREYQG